MRYSDHKYRPPRQYQDKYDRQGRLIMSAQDQADAAAERARRRVVVALDEGSEALDDPPLPRLEVVQVHDLRLVRPRVRPYSVALPRVRRVGVALLDGAAPRFAFDLRRRRRKGQQVV